MSGWAEANQADRDERDAVRELLGSNPDRYLRTYDRMRASGRSWVLGWCWSGFAFGTTFAFYRRLYRPLLMLEGAFTLASAGIMALAATLGFGLRDMVITGVLAGWLPGALVYALLGRAWVVAACLQRLRRAAAMTDPPLADWTGPLRRFRIFLLMLAAAMMLRAVDDSVAMLTGSSRLPSATHPPLPGQPAAPLTGIAPLDVPAAMLMGSAVCLVVGWLVWRWARRANVLWPCSGAVAAGVMAAFAAGIVGEVLPGFVHLLPTEQRLLAENYLVVAPIEEGCKLLLLAWILLPAEPISDRRGAVAAAFLAAVSFEVVETFQYLGGPFNGLADAALRGLPRHLLFAVFTATGLAMYLARRRWWTLLLAWLAATWAHAAYNVGTVILTANLLAMTPLESTFLEQWLGIDPASLVGEPWLAIAYAHLAGLGVALTGAILLLRRVLASPSRNQILRPRVAESAGCGPS